MLDTRYESVLREICCILRHKDIIWALTGSTSFALQGMKLIPNDIDIQTNEAGAYAINELLKEFEIQPVSFSSTEIIRSHFGRFKMGDIFVEVMGDVQKKYNGLWEEIIDLRPLIEYITYKDISLPVTNLTYESVAYRKLGRFERADEIDKFLESRL